MAQSDNDISVARSCLCLWLCGIRLQRYKMIWEQSAYFVSVQVIRSYIVSVSDAQVNRQINTKLAKYKSTVFDTLQKS